MRILKLLWFIAIFSQIDAGLGARCKNGATILANSVSRKDQKNIIRLHNNFRAKISRGLIKGQPRGKNLKNMKYDKKLASLAKRVSHTCNFAHVVVEDKRWKGVGQNIHIQFSTKKNVKPEWKKAVQSWLDEHKFYRFANNTVSKRTTGHYTQIVWADTDYVGCDFIAFKSKGPMPFGRLYTCNYGPGGNVGNAAPYRT